MADVHFDEKTHTYTVDGERVPSVTQVLGDLSAFKRMDPAVLADARMRGELVHQAVQLYNERDLDESTVDPSIVGYLKAWKRFCDDYKFEPQLIEHVVYSERWGYAGKLDAAGPLTEPNRKKRYDALVDAKSGDRDPVHGPQLAAYLEPLAAERVLGKTTAVLRYVVRLRANGLYAVDPYYDPQDWSTFFAALTCHRFKERHGLL